MKLLLLFVAILGVGLAKPSVDEDLVDLLKRELSKVDSDKRLIDLSLGKYLDSVLGPLGSLTSTILNTVDGVVDLVDGLVLDLTKVVDAILGKADISDLLGKCFSKVYAVIDQVEVLLDSISLGQLAKDVLAIVNQVVKLVNSLLAAVQNILQQLNLKAIIASLVGTVGDITNEIGCPLNGDIGKLLPCVVKKVLALNLVSGKLLTDTLSLYASGNVQLAVCPQIKAAVAAKIGGAALGLELKAYLGCVKGNILLLSVNVNVGVILPISLPDLLIPKYLGAGVLVDVVLGVLAQVKIDLALAVNILTYESENDGSLPYVPPTYVPPKDSYSRQAGKK